ncbi:MAG: type I toxin-antitoxin system SymE family toxin [Lachnospiraceae bacterium]|nr:type I toxin-antitoxin system SymE family toxin [Lachnospiraceae bacterium]
MDKKDRKLTVYGKMSKSDKTVPQIRFEGEWLKTLGFGVGDKIRLDCEENRIVITKLLENNK